MRRRKNYPENHTDGKRNKSRMMEGVYGGPDFFARQTPPDTMFQAVYAGPDFFTQSPVPAPGQYGVPAPADADTKRRTWCASCGKDIDASSKFCPECGAQQTGKTCQRCGAPILPNAPFCAECGTPVPKDDDA